MHQYQAAFTVTERGSSVSLELGCSECEIQPHLADKFSLVQLQMSSFLRLQGQEIRAGLVTWADSQDAADLKFNDSSVSRPISLLGVLLFLQLELRSP